jgi:hypothetical protein
MVRLVSLEENFLNLKVPTRRVVGLTVIVGMVTRERLVPPMAGIVTLRVDLPVAGRT